MRKILIWFLLFAVPLFAQVKFDANFESGNLSLVTTTDSVTYRLTTIEDIGGRWFYFKITGVKDRFVKVNIQNSDVNRPMYSYDNKNFVRFSASEAPQINWFQKTFEEDTVYVAYYTPYNYSYLQERISEWSQSKFVKMDTLGFTDHELPMQEMILTDFTVPDDQKYRVWIHARTHPGETPSSWQFDGIVQKLLSNDDVIDYYRQNIVFYLYPFNNPEGVYYGRSRTNFYGVDQEREWNKTPEQTAKEVNMLKNRMNEINNEKVISVFLNLHSQAAPYCTFWIHTPNSTSNYFYQREYQFSNLNTSDNPYFYQPDYRESNLRDYFPEGYLWDTHGDKVMALTYETPYDQYSTDEWVTNENLFELGYRTVYAVAEYLELSHPKHYIIDNTQAIASGNWISENNGLEFYSEDYLSILPTDETSSIVFTTDQLESGLYDIYAWWPSADENSFNTKFEISDGSETTIIEKTQRTNGGQWNFISDIELGNSSAISVSLSGNSSGKVVADAFRIIYRGPVTSIEENIVARNFELHQNYPNPFNPSTTLRFELKEASDVTLTIFNSLGEQVDVLVNQNLGSGTHEVIFNSRNYSSLSSGIYYYRLTAGKYSITKGMILVK